MSEENMNGTGLPQNPEEQEAKEVGSEYRTTKQEPPGHAPTPENQANAKPQRRVSMTTFVVTCVALVLATLMLTYTVLNNVYKQRLAESELDLAGRYYPFELFDAIFEGNSFEELNEEEMLAMALKAYVAQTGDRYAAYYTPEEFSALLAANAGDSEGIGINIINTTVTVNGAEYLVLRVINISPDSPAQEAGVKVGDLIWAVGIGENIETISAIGYDVALTKLKGEAGTSAEFTVLRETDGGYETIEFQVGRAKIITTSVYYHQSTLDPKVGVVKIIQFDLTTPEQFETAIEELKKLGCDRFVFDVRYNPGGDLYSIEAVLSYFLSEGDILIRTKNKDGDEDISRVAPVIYAGDYASCSVAAEDIGKYRDLNAVVLCNGSTASAAELFTATFRDYDLAPIVGTQTFGKGSMQSIISLAQYGYSGALKLTTAMYYPASGEGYDGVGIVPDVVEELNEAAAEQNIYELKDEDDNQLCRALELLAD